MAAGLALPARIVDTAGLATVCPRVRSIGCDARGCRLRDEIGTHAGGMLRVAGIENPASMPPAWSVTCFRSLSLIAIGLSCPPRP